MSISRCRVADCAGKGLYDKKTNKTYLVKGYCYAHYQRYKRYGDPLGGRTLNGKPAKFVQELMLSSSEECIVWPYSRSSHGYAQIRINNKLRTVPRLLLEKVTGLAGDNLDAAHSCGMGDKGCVNPSHLRWDTRRGNMADTIKHKTRVMGEKHPATNLTNKDVNLIRGSSKSQQELAKQFGIKQQAVSKIKLRQRWTHI